MWTVSWKLKCGWLARRDERGSVGSNAECWVTRSLVFKNWSVSVIVEQQACWMLKWSFWVLGRFTVLLAAASKGRPWEKAGRQAEESPPDHPRERVGRRGAGKPRGRRRPGPPEARAWGRRLTCADSDAESEQGKEPEVMADSRRRAHRAG